MTGCHHSALFWILQAVPSRVEEGRGVVCSLTRCSNFVSVLQNVGPPETLKPLISAQPPQWRCYARLVTPQHVFLTFLPATFSGTNH